MNKNIAINRPAPSAEMRTRSEKPEDCEVAVIGKSSPGVQYEGSRKTPIYLFLFRMFCDLYPCKINKGQIKVKKPNVGI